MPRSKHIVLLSGILLVASLFFALTSVASTAFAATNGMHTASKASTLSTASSHLVPDSCPPTCANPINMCPPSQQTGDNNNWVKVIQFRLNALRELGTFSGSPNSYPNPLATDGIFGSNTKNAVIDFQSAEGITGGGGAVGDRTWSAMGFCRGNVTVVEAGTTSTNCPADQSDGGSNTLIFVQAIQALLNIDFDNHIFPNAPQNFHPYLAFDGIFGPDTKAAVIDFQQAAGISGGGGVVGQRTWSALGMCF